MYQQKEPETKRQKQATLTVKYPVKGIEDFLAKSTKAYQRLDVRQKDDMDNICLRCIYERKLFCPTCVLCDRKSVYESVFCPIDNHVGKKDELFWFDKADSPNSEYLEYGCYSGSSSREIGDKIVRNQIFY